MAETTSPVRGNGKRKLRTWGYIGGLLSLFAFLALVPDLVRKTRIPYTASELPSPHIAPFDMASSFGRVTAQGTSQPVTLATLAANNPGGLLINFWATWCPPCLEELPSLETLHRQLEAKNDPRLPKLVTLSVDEAPAEVLRLFKTLTFQPSFRVLFDRDAAFAGKVGTTRFPETYWVGSDGEVRYKWLGPQNWLSESIQRRLASP
jgi:thiol-disulfide isomerase/thioredoxin